MKRRKVLALAMVLALAVPCTAYAAGGRADSLESYGVLSGTGSNGESILIDSNDFRSLADDIDQAESYFNGAYKEAWAFGYSDSHSNGTYMDVVCRHHVHTTSGGGSYGDGAVIRDGTAPGGCFGAGSHTHNSGCPEKALSWSYEGGDGPGAKCPSCGKTGNIWNGGADDGDGHKIANCTHGCKQYTCDRAPNTWNLSCGLSTSTRLSLRLTFDNSMHPVFHNIRSYGGYRTQNQEGDDVLILAQDARNLQGSLNDYMHQCDSKIVSRFIAGVKSRSNPGKPNVSASYGRHSHDAGCYADDGTVLCGKTESTVESISLEFY